MNVKPDDYNSTAKNMNFRDRIARNENMKTEKT